MNQHHESKLNHSVLLVLFTVYTIIVVINTIFNHFYIVSLKFDFSLIFCHLLCAFVILLVFYSNFLSFQKFFYFNISNLFPLFFNKCKQF